MEVGPYENSAAHHPYVALALSNLAYSIAEKERTGPLRRCAGAFLFPS